MRSNNFETLCMILVKKKKKQAQIKTIDLINADGLDIGHWQ